MADEGALYGVGAWEWHVALPWYGELRDAFCWQNYSTKCNKLSFKKMLP